MSPDLADYIRWLRARRARAYAAALELADRATKQRQRPFSAREQRDFDALAAIVDRLDHKLRRLWLAYRANGDEHTGAADVNTWSRANDRSFSAAPGSGSRAATMGAFHR